MLIIYLSRQASPLIQTARANDLDPFEYICEILRKINGHPANKIEEFFPQYFKF